MKKTYQTPACEIISLHVETPILTASGGQSAGLYDDDENIGGSGAYAPKNIWNSGSWPSTDKD